MISANSPQSGVVKDGSPPPSAPESDPRVSASSVHKMTDPYRKGKGKGKHKSDQ